MNSNRRRRSTIAFAAIGLALSLGLPVTAAARQPVDPSTLNPVPPDGYTCQATGSGATCTRYSYDTGSGPSGYFCGDASDPVELWFVDGYDARRGTRFYDQSGNLLERKLSQHDGATVLDPATGRTVQTSQVAEFTTILAIPGDLDSATFTQRGVVKFSAPSFGVLMIDVGRGTIGPGDVLLSEAGKHPLDLYFGGDTSVFAKVCEALGSPGTPPLP